MRPNPGDRRKDFFNKRFYDEQTVAEPLKMPEPKASKLELPPDTVEGIISGSAEITEIGPYKPAMLGFAPVFTPGASDSHLSSHPVYCMAYNDEYYNDVPNLFPIWGITQDFITTTKPGKIKLSGPTWFDDTGLTALEGGGNSYDIFNKKLWKTFGGRAEILSQNSPWALVNLRSCNVVYMGRTSPSGIPLGAAGNVTLYERTDYSFVATSLTISAIAWPSAIVGQQFVEVACRGGRLVAMELC